MESLQALFMPHGYCFSWKPELLLLHASSDIIITLAYYSVASSAFYLAYSKRKTLPRGSLNLLIGLFGIFAACGTGHLANALVIWYPEYWIEGGIKFINAIISSYVLLFMLIPWLPIAIEAPTPAQLEAANQKLREEIAERQKVEEQLRNSINALDIAHQKLIESLQYAKVIQTTLLPNTKQIQAYLPNNFIIWLPRDVVGGDMLYTEQVDGGVLIAVMDCTGHGVSGAFMTMIASTHLRRIVVDENCREPNEILKRLNSLMKTSLQQGSAHHQGMTSDNGLDAAVCFFNPTENTLSFAGARLSLLHCSQYHDMQVIKGNRMSLGYRDSNANFEFTTHLIKVKKFDRYYLTTDGILDELGGEKRLPFGLQHFKNVLLETSQQSFTEQSETLLKTFHDHKGDYDRQDDITVIGFSF
jgi:serine phosphatase RsbU (regulator of sigma subunit)